MSRGGRIRRRRDGSFELRLPRAERDLIRSLPATLRTLLAGDDPALERLFPPAYPDDPERDEEYRRLVRDDLVAGRLQAVELLERTVDATRVTDEELGAWLGALNDARLVLGTKLEVSEDMDFEAIGDDHPEAAGYALYVYLTWLQDQVIEALAAGLDDGPERHG